MNEQDVAILIETLRRLADAAERIADALESANERESYDAALARWQSGQGKHPDD